MSKEKDFSKFMLEATAEYLPVFDYLGEESQEKIEEIIHYLWENDRKEDVKIISFIDGFNLSEITVICSSLNRYDASYDVLVYVFEYIGLNGQGVFKFLQLIHKFPYFQTIENMKSIALPVGTGKYYGDLRKFFIKFPDLVEDDELIEQLKFVATETILFSDRISDIDFYDIAVFIKKVNEDGSFDDEIKDAILSWLPIVGSDSIFTKVKFKNSLKNQDFEDIFLNLTDIVNLKSKHNLSVTTVKSMSAAISILSELSSKKISSISKDVNKILIDFECSKPNFRVIALEYYLNGVDLKSVRRGLNQEFSQQSELKAYFDRIEKSKSILSSLI